MNDHPSEQTNFADALREGEHQLRQGRFAEAVSRLRSLLTTVPMPTGARRALVLDALGRALHGQERPAEALTAFTEAAELLRSEPGTEQVLVAVLQHLAHACRATGDNAACCRYGQQAVDAAAIAFGPDHPAVAATLFSLSHSVYSERRYDEAESMVRRCMGIWERHNGPECPEMGACLNNLGRIYEERGELDTGIALHRQAVALRRKILGDHPETAFSLGNLGTSLASAGLWNEAISNLEAAIACYTACGQPNAPEVPGYQRNLALCREALRQTR